MWERLACWTEEAFTKGENVQIYKFNGKNKKSFKPISVPIFGHFSFNFTVMQTQQIFTKRHIL